MSVDIVHLGTLWENMGQVPGVILVSIYSEYCHMNEGACFQLNQ